MDKQERIVAHHIDLCLNYMPDPHHHLDIPRDLLHYEKVLKVVMENGSQRILDVGCFDGWLDFLLMEKGFNVTGVELIPSLADSALRYASEHYLNYKVHQGFFEDIEFTIWDKFDTVICLETLEHVDLNKTVPIYIEKMEALSLKGVFISLPDQNHGDNKQHLWTPTKDIIHDLWGTKKDISIDYHKYDSPNYVPPNWLIYYEV